MNNTLKTYGTDGTYDATGGYYGRLWEIKTLPQSGGTALQDVKHTWDAGDNLATRLDVLASETETFGYDFLDRLTGVTGPYTESFTYNTIGNLTSKNGATYTYGQNGAGPHAVTAICSDSYTYDDNGNMIGHPQGLGNIVNCLTLTSGGSGYTSAPSVSISGGGGSGATASATLAATSVNSISLTSGGSGYTSAPSVSITGGGGSGATASATLAATSVSSISKTSGGSGYTSLPPASFSNVIAMARQKYVCLIVYVFADIFASYNFNRCSNSCEVITLA